MVDKLNAERILYALKNGVVPDTCLDLLCVGREDELKEFDRLLDFVQAGNSSVKFVTGNYGSGKSFLLNVLKENALKKNFVVSKIQIDKSLKFNKIEDIYFYIMHNLRILGGTTDGTSFEDIFNKWLNNLKASGDKVKSGKQINDAIDEINNYNSSFANVFKNFIKAKLSNNRDIMFSISAWLKGEKNIPATIKSKFEVKSDIDKSNALNILKSFIKLINILGYSGLVILVDEIELIVNERKDIRRNSYENIRMLVDMSADGELSNTMIVFAGTNELFENEEKGIKTYSALSNRLLSSYEFKDVEYKDLRQPVIKIGGLDIESIVNLTNTIVSIHGTAYDWTVPVDSETIEKFAKLSCCKFGNNISSINCREYLKKLIDILDIMEQNPHLNLIQNEINSLSKLNLELKNDLDIDLDDYDNIELDDYDNIDLEDFEDEIIDL